MYFSATTRLKFWTRMCMRSYFFIFLFLLCFCCCHRSLFIANNSNSIPTHLCRREDDAKQRNTLTFYNLLFIYLALLFSGVMQDLGIKEINYVFILLVALLISEKCLQLIRPSKSPRNCSWLFKVVINNRSNSYLVFICRFNVCSQATPFSLSFKTLEHGAKTCLMHGCHGDNYMCRT